MSGEQTRRALLTRLGAATASITALTTVGTHRVTAIQPVFGYTDHIQADTTLLADYINGPEELCQLIQAGCTLATAAAVYDMIPADEAVIVGICAVPTATCTLWQVFKDKHPEADAARVIRVDESIGKLSQNDKIVVPATWTDWG